MRRSFGIVFIILVTVLWTAPADGPHRETNPPPPGFVDVKEFIPDIELDIRYATTNNFTGEILDGYYAPRAFLLKEAAAALKNVQASLKKKGYSLKVFDAYRPMRAEAHMNRWAIRNGRADLVEDGFLPTVNPNKLHSHSCGNAIDVTIVDARGRELDMGTDFDYFGKEAWTQNATGAVLENRLFLKREMEQEGFKGYPYEWWHFNFPKTPNKSSDYPIE